MTFTGFHIFLLFFFISFHISISVFASRSFMKMITSRVLEFHCKHLTLWMIYVGVSNSLSCKLYTCGSDSMLRCRFAMAAVWWLPLIATSNARLLWRQEKAFDDVTTSVCSLLVIYRLELFVWKSPLNNSVRKEVGVHNKLPPLLLYVQFSTGSNISFSVLGLRSRLVFKWLTIRQKSDNRWG